MTVSVMCIVSSKVLSTDQVDLNRLIASGISAPYLLSRAANSINQISLILNEFRGIMQDIVICDVSVCIIYSFFPTKIKHCLFHYLHQAFHVDHLGKPNIAILIFYRQLNTPLILQ